MGKLSDEACVQELAGDLGDVVRRAVSLNELHVPKSLEDLEFPELLETLTGRVGVASLLRLSPPETTVLYSHSFSFSGVHVFFPGEDTSVYVTTWVDAVEGPLDCEAVEFAFVRIWYRWYEGGLVPWHRTACRWTDFPTESAQRSLLETLVRTGRR
jgi:hypothetical protein